MPCAVTLNAMFAKKKMKFISNLIDPWLGQIYTKSKQARASLVAQTVRNLPATRETWFGSLCKGRSPGEGRGEMSTLQYSCLENSMDGRAW